MSDESDSRVDILLATFNGEAWLSGQLSSIAAQTHANWRLIVRDDGSTDETPSILRAFQRSHAGKVEILSDDLGNLRTAANFGELMRHSTAQYCAFCDQDDVWDADKLEAAFSAIRDMTAIHGADTPLLVVTDRRVVDVKGNPVTSSLWATDGFIPDADTTFFDLLASPISAGSCMLMNAALRPRALPIPPEAIMYDCWIELVALCLGEVRFVNRAALTHIRHQSNVSGSRFYPSRKYIRRAVFLLRNLRKQRKLYRRFLAQARALLSRHGGHMKASERERLEEFISLEGAGPIRKLRHLARAGALPPTIERKLAFLLII